MSTGWDAACRPVGFVLLMVGFGVRLDTGWDLLGWALLVPGAVIGGIGLWALCRGSVVGTSVPEGSKR